MGEPASLDAPDTHTRVDFIRCECGAEWRYSLNLMDGKPIWTPPRAKRGAMCQHRPDQAEALVDDEWIKVST